MIEPRPECADRSRAARHPAVDAVEHRRDAGDKHDAPRQGRRRGLTDEAGEPRHQYGADECDLIGGTEVHVCGSSDLKSSTTEASETNGVPRAQQH